MSAPLHIDDWVVDAAVKDSLTCTICLELLYQPVNLSTCSHTFCRLCLQKHVDSSNDPCCSDCRAPLSANIRSLLSTADCINGFCTEQLRKVKVSCPYCMQWSGIVGFDRCNVNQHYRECGEMPVLCSVGCGQSLRRNKAAAHESDECPRRVVKCERCHRPFAVEDIPRHHINDKECEQCHLCQLGCGQLLLDTAAEAHVKEQCSHRSVQCPVCDVAVRQDLLDTHLQANLVNHVNSLVSSNASLKQQLASVTSQLAEAVSRMQKQTDALCSQMACVSKEMFGERVLSAGQWVDALDTSHQWLCARVVQVHDRRVLLNYSGWSDKWNEWFDMSSPRIQCGGTKTSLQQVLDKGKRSPGKTEVLPANFGS